MSVGKPVTFERERSTSGDPRLDESARALLLRLATGDLADAFQEALDRDIEDEREFDVSKDD